MRLFLAIKAFFKIIFSSEFGNSVRAITDGSAERIKDLESATADLKNRLSDTETKLEDSRTTVESLTSDLQKITAAKTTLSKELEEALKASKTAATEKSQAIDKHASELDTVKQELEKTFEAVSLAQSNMNKVMATSANGPAILLSLLQREGRLIDFMMEDISDFDDEQVGAAIRPVHTGCQKVFTDYVKLGPIEKGNEGDTVNIEAGFDPFAVKLTGKVKGEPPFKGTLHHHGWIINELNLPARPESHTAEVVAPAEVEIG